MLESFDHFISDAIVRRQESLFKETSDLSFFEELSFALFNNEGYGMTSWYVDLTEGTVISLPSDYERLNLNNEPCSISQLEMDFIKKHFDHDHELIKIIPVRSYISFEIMEHFAETYTEKQRTILLNALRKTSFFNVPTCSRTLENSSRML
ncbi:MAG: hypothetical protein KBT33_06475 [Prevotellaceae bacterium]|nr:hypothetical protein [Candidatus Minthosoma equi]